MKKFTQIFVALTMLAVMTSCDSIFGKKEETKTDTATAAPAVTDPTTGVPDTTAAASSEVKPDTNKPEVKEAEKAPKADSKEAGK